MPSFLVSVLLSVVQTCLSISLAVSSVLGPAAAARRIFDRRSLQLKDVGYDNISLKNCE